MEVDCRKHAEILLLFCISLLFTSNVATGAMTYGAGDDGVAWPGWIVFASTSTEVKFRACDFRR